MHVWGDCPREKWVIPFFMPISDVLTRLYRLTILSSLPYSHLLSTSESSPLFPTIFSSLPHDFLSATPRFSLRYSTIFSSLPHDFLSATPRSFLSYSKPVSPLFAQNVREK